MSAVLVFPIIVGAWLIADALNNVARAIREAAFIAPAPRRPSIIRPDEE